MGLPKSCEICENVEMLDVNDHLPKTLTILMLHLDRCRLPQYDTPCHT